MGDAAERLVGGDAWRDWCDRLRALGEEILGPDYPSDPRGRAEGFRALARLSVYATQMELEAGDPRFPSFVRLQDPYNQWGGPNPDNVYLRAPVDPACSYRVWADVSGVRQAIISLHEGDMQLGEYGVYSERSLDELERDANGALELRVSPDEQAGNWMPMHASARLLTIRVYQADWERDAAPPFHIERVGAEGLPRPPLDPAFATRALDRAATWVESSVRYWNGFTRDAWSRSTPNRAAPARSTPGGADHILYGNCCWDLAEDEALLLECEVPDADYWSFATHTLAWLESGSFAERQTSLNGEQIHVDGDGVARLALAHRDPGTPNWLDTEGRARGLLVYRWVWSRSNPEPRARVTRLADVRSLLPADHPRLDEAARRRALSRRREAAWSRYL